MEGGHSVPSEKIVQRYARSMANLLTALELVDRAYVYDNSVDGVDARLGLRVQDGQLREIYGGLPEWMADAALSLPRHPELVDLRAA